jgi:hypothetical protein
MATVRRGAKAAPPTRKRAPGPTPERIPPSLTSRYGFDHKKAMGVRKEQKDGETKTQGFKTMFSHRPITITAKMVDLDDRVEYWELTWLTKSGERRSERVEREIAKSPVKLGKVDAYGLPGIPGALPHLARFLSDVESEATIPRGYLTKRLGWQRETDGVERWFLWGSQVMTEGGSTAPPLEFHADEALRMLYRACRQKGSLRGWKDAIAQTEAFPPVVAAILTALASPMLRVLDAPPFITDLAAKTSTGKTMALTIAGSTTGQPDVKGGNNRDSVVQTMKSASNVGFEVLSATMGSLPMLIDDSKTARNRHVLEQFIYQQASGSGAIRGRPDGGIRDIHRWLNTCVTTGEAPLATNSEAGGAAARVLTLNGQPFGPKDPDTGQLVTQLHNAVKANYGWALPTLVQYALDHQGDWATWRRDLEAEEARLLKEAQGADEEVRRQSEFVAVLSITGRVAVEAGVLPFDPAEAIDAVWRQICAGGEDLDKPRKAIGALRSWLDLNPHRVFDRREGRGGPHDKPPEGGPHLKFDNGEIPNQDWGRAPNGGWVAIRDEDFIAITAASLRKVMEELDYDAREVRVAWRDAGWLAAAPSEPQKTTMKYRPPNGMAGNYVCVLTEPTDDL